VISPTIQNGPDWYCWFSVVASENGTRLKITPTDTTKNGWLPGQTYTINLNQGEVYTVFGKMVPGNSQAWAASKDLTGSKIVSVPGNDGNCHPVAFYSGSSGIRICRGDGGEYMNQQVFPTQAWGTRYLTYHTINNANTDLLETNRNYYRICVMDPTTIVKRNGVTLTGINRNFFYEIMDSTGGDYIEADKPITVAQFTVNKNQCWNFPVTSPSPPSYGDPEMFYISPIEQGQKSILFYVSRKSTIDYVYVNIHVPTAALASLKVDGNNLPAANIVTHPHNGNYSVAIARFTGAAAQHTITCDSAVTATVYGLGNYESYGYNVGTLVNNLNYFSGIKNANNTTASIDTFTCPKTPSRLFIKLGFPATFIQWHLSQVNGIFPNVDSNVTSPVLIRTESINGRTYYVYSLDQDFTFTQPGTYYIPITYGAAVIENCSQTEEAKVKVVVKTGPTADFSISSNNCKNENITFTGGGNPGVFTINSYLWNFADNTSATTVNTIKSFSTTGPQDVRFRVFASNGCVGDTTKTITIDLKPTVGFTVSGKPCVDSTYTFNSTSLTGGTTASWNWQYGDGNNFSSTTQSFTSHIYTTPASNFYAKHWIRLSGGCTSDTAQFQIKSIRSNPIAQFGFFNGPYCEKDSVGFNSTLTGIANWQWNFGNGTGNNTPSFKRVYDVAGTYSPTLTVTDTAGCGSASATRSLLINTKPIVSAGRDLNIIFGTTVQLNATVNGNASNFNLQWTPPKWLNNTNTLTPSSKPDSSITYILKATDVTTGCSNTDTILVNVYTALQIPTGFTPNNDGLNDKWIIPGLALYPNAEVYVFNRGGQVIFQSKSYMSQPWDGTFQGKNQPIGVYVYIIKLNDSKNQVLKGVISILK
jgi:gliding motility-associated-like protein